MELPGAAMATSGLFPRHRERVRRRRAVWNMLRTPCSAPLLPSLLLLCCLSSCCAVDVLPEVQLDSLIRSKFQGKVAAVTGGASGIGLSLARRCLRSGMKVVLSDGNPDLIEKAKMQLKQESLEGFCALRADVRRPEEMAEVLRCCQDNFGRVDLFFNNAGVIGEPDKGVLDTPLESWKWILDTNVVGLINGMQTFVPYMEKQGFETHIVNTASGAGLYSQHRETMGPYVSSKHCAVVLTQAMQVELAKRNSSVTPHLLCPSVVATPLVANSRFYLSSIRPLEDGLDPVSKHFDERLNQDGMSADMAVVEDRFLIMTHPEITEKRITSRYHELKQHLHEQPNTGY